MLFIQIDRRCPILDPIGRALHSLQGDKQKRLVKFLCSFNGQKQVPPWGRNAFQGNHGQLQGRAAC